MRYESADLAIQASFPYSSVKIFNRRT